MHLSVENCCAVRSFSISRITNATKTVKLMGNKPLFDNRDTHPTPHPPHVALRPCSHFCLLACAYLTLRPAGICWTHCSYWHGLAALTRWSVAHSWRCSFTVWMPALCPNSHCLSRSCSVLFQLRPLRQCGSPPHQKCPRGLLRRAGVNACRSKGSTLYLLPPTPCWRECTEHQCWPLIHQDHAPKSRLNSRKRSARSSFLLTHPHLPHALEISMASTANFTWISSVRTASRKIKLEMPSQTPVLTLLMEI